MERKGEWDRKGRDREIERGREYRATHREILTETQSERERERERYTQQHAETDRVR